ncbi:TIR domain-containing protein [Streptomyces sp. MST-110588]|uniref:TIR domain-containing protein n=1 Tax=Streptomyces sp. MST-110588 TaxID=2833628 RepID=UPI001F5E20BC|nr:TIR domain-containing protein [Streptomyces sp. MST-110588]UNO43337.1 TIR domain-containing protein [Streptomyces sp. MST-110588]
MARRPGRAEDGKRGFDAFISYSSAADSEVAPAIQQGLHRLARPWYRRRALRVFRDGSGLETCPDLWRSLAEKLGRTDSFILLASPESARSEWVAREVGFWLHHKSTTDFYIVLTRGEIHWDASRGDFDWRRTDALPAILENRFAAEPKWADLRWIHEEMERRHGTADAKQKAGNPLSLKHRDFHREVCSLAAPLHRMDMDHLYAEDARRHRRAIGALWSGIAVVTALSCVAGLAIHDSIQEGQDRDRQQRTAREQQLRRTRGDLMGQAARLRDARPQLALRMNLAADTIRPTAQSREELLASLTATHCLGSAHGPAVHPGIEGGASVVSGSGGGFFVVRFNRSSAAAFSPDGTRLAVVGKSGKLELRDVASPGRQRTLATLGNMSEGANSLSFSPDGRQLVAVGVDNGNVRLWDVSDPRRPYASSLPHTDKATGAAFGPDGTRLLLATDSTANELDDQPNGKISFWAAGNGKPSWQGEYAGLRDASDVVVSPDGRTLLTVNRREIGVGKAGGGIKSRTPAGVSVFDVRNSAQAVPRGRIDGWVSGPVFSPDSSMFALADGPRITLWSNAPDRPPKLLATLKGHRKTVRDLGFNRDGTLLASGGDDGRVILWDTARPSGKITAAHLLGHPGAVQAVAFRPDGEHDRVVSVDDTGAVFHWRAANPGPSRLAADHRPYAATLQLSSDGTMAATGEPGESLQGAGERTEAVALWDIRHRTRLALRSTYKVHPAGTPVAFSPDGRLLATGEADDSAAELDLWRTSGRRGTGPASTWTVKGNAVLALTFSPDGKRLLTAGEAGTTAWHLTGPKPVKGASLPALKTSDTSGTSDPQPWELTYLPAASATGSSVVMLTGDGGTVLADERGKRLRTVKGGHAAVAGNGKVMATVTGTGKKVALWDIRSPLRPRPTGELPGTVTTVGRLAVNPRGTLLASWESDGTITLWDITRPREPVRAGSLAHDTAEPGPLAFTRQGDALVTGGGDGITVWGLGALTDIITDPVGRACRIANGGLSRAEWKRYAPGIPYQDGCAP